MTITLSGSHALAELGSYGSEKNGIADSMQLALEVNQRTKPTWLIVGAFESMDSPQAAFLSLPHPDAIAGWSTAE